MAPVLPYFYRRTHLNGVALTDVERELFGIDHAKLGGDLAHRWSLPEDLVSTIDCHHDPNTNRDGTDLVCIVYLADLIMSRFMMGQELERIDAQGFLLQMQNAGITSEKFLHTIDHIPTELFDQSCN